MSGEAGRKNLEVTMFQEEVDDTTAVGRRFGKYPAIVTRNDVEDTAHTGRIQVRIPGILEEDEKGDPRPIEVVARPCLPPGFFFVPDKGSHVWVEFAAGDINAPIWVGVWYSKDAPPQTSEGEAPEAQQKVIRTRGGHVVTLDDDAETVVVKDRHGSRLTLERESVTIEHADGAQVVLSSGKATITAASIELKDGGPVKSLLTDDAAVLQYLVSHQHTGNLGIPTGPPTPTPVFTTWFTTKTKAE